MKVNLDNEKATIGLEKKQQLKAQELIDIFSYHCRECGDLDKAKIIATTSINETIKELDDLANIIQNTNHDNAWIFVNIIGDKIFYLEKRKNEIELYKTVSK